ncbi:hypothetical protein ACRE_069010 [Hapsidospora chrysogenum ATCC 11550]|uniref:CBF1-interacting co-repressor CIR N-terminal domain-containing protein n=1 Tax=Hapsidospora chrysogenum (strain ATCC 11550 / CBS 779.69 / DSM 880 / IAM 14645 / JCM 23072 / IMI 49137) TaxID=857340 RepID=A0A086SZ33_HAPC1|nr:hypothetical protein ACRE_069010 [Hapsidospora chrysogenum ATCC 11550]
MPLHLLGKKSWNVYNADNIARVRRDEAAAKAAEEAEEQRMQEVDAQRRMAILRGEAPPPPTPDEPAASEEVRGSPGTRDTYPGGSGMRKRRKRAGEDDTEFEMRLASERLEPTTTTSLGVEARRPTSSAPLTDKAGHIDLFGDERARAQTEKNEEAEKEKKKKQRELEDQYTMRFSNAAGKGGMDKAWYSKPDALDVAERPMKDVWGNEDPRRKERDVQRLVASDPLAMMKKGASKVRELKEERRRIQEERDEELRQLRREQRHRHHRKEKRRHGRRGDDGSPPVDSGRRRHRSRDGHGSDGDHDREIRRRRDKRERSAERSGGRRHKSRDGRGDDRGDRERSRHRSRSPSEHRRHRHRHEK